MFRWLRRSRSSSIPSTRSVRQLSVELLEDRTAPAVLGQLRIATYNILQTPSGADFTTVLDAINNQSFAGLTRDIDIILLQEVNNAGTDDDVIRNILNSLPGSSGQYVTGPLGGSDGSIRQGVVYNDATVDLIGSQIISSPGPRDPIRYQLRPQGLDSSYDFYIYNSHYDASDASDRLGEAQNIRANADALGQGTEILYVGDFNIDSSSEGMYTTLLGAGNGQAFDPINTPGMWHDSNGLKITHTQNPAGSGFVGGGMDDRFDFILHSQEVGASGTTSNGGGLEYRVGSYRAFGNNGTHTLNGHINTGSGASSAVLNALGISSDHLPVVADYDIVSPDPPSVSFTASTQSGPENGGALVITAQLSGTTNQVVTLPFTVNGTATGGGTDYTITSSPITIPIGMLTGTITITLQNDLIDEASETVVVTLGTPTNATLGAITVHTATITDDDPPPTVSFTTASQFGPENVGTMEITAELSSISGLAVTVPFTVGGSASNPSDYTITSSPLVIAPGLTTATITIDVVNDGIPESDKTVEVTMGAPTNATLGTTTVHTATIVDDDATTFRVIALVRMPDGFEATFNRALNPAEVNQFNQQGNPVGGPDVQLLYLGANGVLGGGDDIDLSRLGTLVFGPDAAAPTQMRFIRTGTRSFLDPSDGLLTAGNYQVTLLSGINAFKDQTSGELLDGDTNGSPGGNYVGTFVVPTLDPNAVILSVPDFARGPGQPVTPAASITVPADPNFPGFMGSQGIPFVANTGQNFSSYALTLTWNPDSIAITGFVRNPILSGTSTFTPQGGGIATLQQSAPGEFQSSAGHLLLGWFMATVPSSAPYSATDALDLSITDLLDSGAQQRASVANDGVHVVAYLGDLNADGATNSGDSLLLSRHNVNFGGNSNGFLAYPNVDPRLLADFNIDGLINSGDSLILSRENVGGALDQPAIPPLPSEGIMSGSTAIGQTAQWFDSNADSLGITPSAKSTPLAILDSLSSSSGAKPAVSLPQGVLRWTENTDKKQTPKAQLWLSSLPKSLNSPKQHGLPKVAKLPETALWVDNAEDFSQDSSFLHMLLDKIR